MARRHFIPKWLLRQFRASSPWVLDTTTGQIYELGLKKAGQVEDAWDQEIEDEVMSLHDNRAAEIFYARIAGRQRVKLSPIERQEFAQWLCLFAYRVPDSYAFVERRWGEIKSDKTELTNLFSSERAKLLKILQEDYPQFYSEVTHANGEEEGESIIFNDLMQIVSERSNQLLAPAERVWHHNIRNSTIDREAQYLTGYHWTWLDCRHDLIIGDNPLVRWNPTTNRSYRHLDNSGVEVTFPLGANLCLHVQRARRNDNGWRQHGTKAMSAELNRRQVQCCIDFMYAGKRELLEPWGRTRRPGRNEFRAPIRA